MTRKHDNNPKRTSNRPAKPKALRANPPRLKRSGADPAGGNLGRPLPQARRGKGARRASKPPVGGDLGRPLGSSAVTPRKGGASPAPTEGDAHVPADADRAIIVATVQGDIHDIGKNIVKMLLENYGFTVIDLGRDVAPEAIVAAARDTGARLIGLSALMTTTVGAMERTIALVHEQLPGVAVMVGGAVITQEFADQIGADFYAKDAAASTRVASTFFDD